MTTMMTTTTTNTPTERNTTNSGILTVNNNDTTIQQQIEHLKEQGNASFQKQLYHEAITLYYNPAIVLIDKNVTTTTSDTTAALLVLKCTILSNRAMAYIKLYNNKATMRTMTDPSNGKTQLQHAIDDCQLAVTLLNHHQNTTTITSTTTDTNTLRCKLLYRSAKARFLLANHNDTKTVTTNSSITTVLLNDAAKDLLHLFDIDRHHKEGNQLMQLIRNQHHMLNAPGSSSTGNSSSNSTSAISKLLSFLAATTTPATTSTTTTTTTDEDIQTKTQLEQSIVQLYSIIHEDVSSSCKEMIRFRYANTAEDAITTTLDGLDIVFQCVTFLLSFEQQQQTSPNENNITNKSTKTLKVGWYWKSIVLLLQCIATISNQIPTFVRSHLATTTTQTKLVSLLQSIYDNSTAATTTATCSNLSDSIVVLLSIWHSILLHSDRDPLLLLSSSSSSSKETPTTDEVQSTTKIQYPQLLQTMQLSLLMGQFIMNSNDGNSTKQTTTSSTTIYRAVMDIISVFIAGSSDRDHRIRISLLHHHGSGNSSGSTKSIQSIDPLLPNPMSPQEIRNLSPQQLASYKKRQHDVKVRNDAWSYERSLLLFGKGQSKINIMSDSQINIVQQLLQIAIYHCLDDVIVRREMTICISRIISSIDIEDTIKDVLRPYVHSVTNTTISKDEPYIEEIYNDDDKEEAKQEISSAPIEKVYENDGVTITKSFEIKIIRAIVATAVLLLPSKKECTNWILSSDGWNTASEDIPILIQSQYTIALCYVVEVIQAAAVLEGTRPIVMNLVSSGSMEVLMKSPHRDIRSGAAAAIAKLGLANTKKGIGDGEEGELMGLLQAACELFEDRDEERNETKVDLTSTKSSLNSSNQYSSYATSSVERAVEMITYLVAHTTIKEEIAAGFGGTSGKPVLELLVEAADQSGAGESMSGYSLANIFQLLAVTNEQLRREAFEGKEVTMEQHDEMQRMGKTEEEKEIMDQEKDTDTKELCQERIRKMAQANVPRALVALTENASEQTLEQLAISMNRMADEISVRGIMIQQGVLSVCIKIEKAEGPTETDVMKKVIRTARHCIAKMLITTNPSLLTSAQKLGAVKPLISLIRDIKASDLQHFEALLAITNIGSSGEDSKNRIVSEKGISTFHFAMFSDHELVRRAATEALCNLVPHEKMMEHLAEVDNLRLWLAFAVDYEEPHYECARAATGCLAMATQDESIAQTLIALDKFKVQMTTLLESGRLEIMHRSFVIVFNLVLHGSDIRKAAVNAGLIEFCRAYIELQNHGVAIDEFTAEERQLIPITVDIAKKIVLSADE